MILALNRGGVTSYFGPVGENGSVIVDYFAARGFHCPPNRNVAEFILETASKPTMNDQGELVDWNDEWRRSDEAKAIEAEIDSIMAEQKEAVATDRKATKFAAPTWKQSLLLTKRTFIKHWREPHYVYGRLFVHVTMGILVGFVSTHKSQLVNHKLTQSDLLGSRRRHRFSPEQNVQHHHLCFLHPPRRCQQRCCHILPKQGALGGSGTSQLHVRLGSFLYCKCSD